jgi:hypothetical protein
MKKTKLSKKPKSKEKSIVKIYGHELWPPIIRSVEPNGSTYSTAMGRKSALPQWLWRKRFPEWGLNNMY